MALPKTKQVKMFKEMANIKNHIKSLTKMFKELEEIAFDNKIGDYENVQGKFKASKKETYKVMDKCNLVKLMGVACYKEHSTISKTGIIKGIGTKGFDKALKKEFVELTKTSHFYKFTAAKEAKK